MRPLTFAVALAIAGAALVGVPDAKAVGIVVEGDSLVGRVFNSSNGAGLPGYSVRLIPPRVSGLPIRVAFTGQDGGFRFRAIKKQRYVLEISRGVLVVYRKEIDASQPQRFSVALRPTSVRAH